MTLKQNGDTMTIEDMRDRKGLMALIARNMPNVPSVLADKILGSRWLAEHDRQVEEAAKAMLMVTQEDNHA